MTHPLAVFLRYLAVEKNASRHTLRSYRTDLRQFCDYLATDSSRGAPAATIDAVDTRQSRGWLASLHGRRRDATSTARKPAALRSWVRSHARRGPVARHP